MDEESISTLLETIRHQRRWRPVRFYHTAGLLASMQVVACAIFGGVFIAGGVSRGDTPLRAAVVLGPVLLTLLLRRVFSHHLGTFKYTYNACAAVLLISVFVRHNVPWLMQNWSWHAWFGAASLLVGAYFWTMSEPDVIRAKRESPESN